MAQSKENIQKQNYRIKLLAGKSVILVESDNYESEIFVPQLVNGRITLSNILPNRRCCLVGETNLMNSTTKRSFIESRCNINDENFPKRIKLNRFPSRENSREYGGMRPPLANSTPAAVKNKCSSASMSKISLISNPYESSTYCDLPTPEPVRKAIPAQPKMRNSLTNLPPGAKVVRMFHNSHDGTPQKLGRLVTSTSNISSRRSTANISFLNESFKLPNSSSKLSNKRPRSGLTICPPTPEDCIARWKKVLTPIRTYTKNINKARQTVSSELAEKSSKQMHFTPTYLVNPTKGIDVKEKIVMKKRRLIIDTKLSISPKTFKKQQKEPLTTHKPKSNTSQPSYLSLNKPRSYLESMGMSAFDLLINSNRCGRMSSKLNKQFRKGCVNKASSTNEKYKVLSSVPPLQQDVQVLNLSTIPFHSPHNSTEDR